MMFVKAPKKGYSMMGKVYEGDPAIKPLQFLVFAGSTYYPNGGWGDLIGSADNKDEAVKAAQAEDEDWWHVIDLHSGEEVQ